MHPIFREHNPPRLSNYKRYKPYLRDDFQRRCAYCHIPELRYGAQGNFHVDHFRPKSRYAELICHYPNLYYACKECNEFKSDGDGPFLDPCRHIFSDHFDIGESGEAKAKTTLGGAFILKLNLNREHLVLWRRHRSGSIERLRFLDRCLQFTEDDPRAHQIHTEALSDFEQESRKLRDEFGDWWPYPAFDARSRTIRTAASSAAR